jgi:hypothetical protein
MIGWQKIILFFIFLLSKSSYATFGADAPRIHAVLLRLWAVSLGT